MLGPYRFRGCKGLQPSKLITAIKVLIGAFHPSTLPFTFF
jgi:hypothetical protein